MWLKIAGETMQSRSNASCRCAHAGVIFAPPPLGVSIRGYGIEAIDTTRGYVMQQGSKERHRVNLPGWEQSRLATRHPPGNRHSYRNSFMPEDIPVCGAPQE